MDVSILLVFVTLFLVACFSLFAVYKLGIKEKSYEEALAEQRQQTSALLGAKAKPKEKRNKKVGKKSKDKEQKYKVAAPQENETDESENVEPPVSTPEKSHVEFKEEPEVQPPFKKRVKKLGPILVKNHHSPIRVDSNESIPMTNRFEENPPKDELELLRSNSKDNSNKQEQTKEKPIKEKKIVLESTQPPAPVRNKKEKTIKQILSNAPPSQPPVITEPLVVKETVEKSENVPSTVPIDGVIIGNPGKEKKKKKSEFNARQQLTATDRDGLLNSVRKAELSKTETQMLIDLLLNKQLDGPGVILDDWSEGKSDPIQKLKRQLADKEKLLESEQQALVSAQAKLRDVRAEQQAERQSNQQKFRLLEELAQSKELECQATANRLQVEVQKVQQLQAELNNEILKNRKVVEDNVNIQRQIKQLQESEGIMGKLRNDCEDLSNANQQLRMELQQMNNEKQHFLTQLSNLEKALEQQNEITRQLKDNNQKLERNLEITVRQHDEWNIETGNLKGAFQQQYEEKLKLEHTLHQLKEELHVTTNEKIESNKIIAQLRTDLRTLQDQFSQINGNSEVSKNHEVEVLNLTNELTSLKNELTSVQTQLQQTDKKYKSELEISNKQYHTLEKELEEQKSKNDELRVKNWKVIEALKAAENSKSNIDPEQLKTEILGKERDAQKLFVQRLFPEIPLSTVTSEDWQTEYSLKIKSYVQNLQQTQQKPQPTQIAKLESQLQHYKIIIDDTEGMLNKLQSHIEQEEINWRQDQSAKEAEIEKLRLETTQLQADLAEIKIKLAEEIEKRQCINQSSSSSNQDQTATIERLSEEVNRLQRLLVIEQSKNEDIRVPIKANNCNNSVNGSNFVEASER